MQKHVVNKEDFDKDPRPLDKGLWDGVVDTVGGKILANALAQTRDNGIVAACGNASDYELKHNCDAFYNSRSKTLGNKFCSLHQLKEENLCGMKLQM